MKLGASGMSMRDQSAGLRHCLRMPIPEIEEAARLLDAAVSAHRDGKQNIAEELLHFADNDRIRAWTESVWGKRSPHTQLRMVPNPLPILPKVRRIKLRMPTTEERREIHARDGYYCRFCGIPVVRSEIRSKIAQAYPGAVCWGHTNDSQHAAFQAMWAQYDHVLPHARGGTNDVGNVILACAPCNYGRMNYTLQEVGLVDPRTRTPRLGTWGGLEHFRP